MDTPSKAAAKWAPYLLSTLRIAVGIVFIRHGMQRLFGFPFGGMDHNFLTLNGIAGPMAFAGGLLMILGLFTRPVSFILSGQMAVAYWARWAPRGFWRSLIVGEASIYFCFLYLLMSAVGGGPWSLDHLLSRSRKRSEPLVSTEELVGSSES